MSHFLVSWASFQKYACQNVVMYRIAVFYMIISCVPSLPRYRNSRFVHGKHHKSLIIRDVLRNIEVSASPQWRSHRHPNQYPFPIWFVFGVPLKLRALFVLNCRDLENSKFQLPLDIFVLRLTVYSSVPVFVAPESALRSQVQIAVVWSNYE